MTRQEAGGKGGAGARGQRGPKGGAGGGGGGVGGEGLAWIGFEWQRFPDAVRQASHAHTHTHAGRQARTHASKQAVH